MLRKSQKKFVKRSAAMQFHPGPIIQLQNHGKRQPEAGLAHPVDRQYKSAVARFRSLYFVLFFFCGNKGEPQKKKNALACLEQKMKCNSRCPLCRCPVRRPRGSHWQPALCASCLAARFARLRRLAGLPPVAPAPAQLRLL